MRDTTNQLVLGTFIATFLYCLLVLLHIRYAEEGAFVPSLSVTLGVVFALASLWVLIYFIHHVSMSVQADDIVARVGRELFAGIDRLFPEQIGSPANTAEQAEQVVLPDSSHQSASQIAANGDGYLQLIEADSLLALAVEHDIVLRLELRPGHYVVAGMPLVSIFPAAVVNGADDGGDALRQRINNLFVIGNQRSSVQDIEFVIEQLVEVAARALSPGINDPFTAIACVNRLGSALCRAASRKLPSSRRFDEKGVLRILAQPITFAQLTDAAFNQIRQYARSNVAVTLRLLETLAIVATATHRAVDRTALQRHADMMIRGARQGLAEEDDLHAAEQRYATLCSRIGGGQHG